MKKQEITFEQASVNVRETRDGRESIIQHQVTIGVGTGLAYYLDKDSEYALVHIQSGYGIPPGLCVPTEDEAKTYLAKVAQIINHDCDLATIKRRMQHKAGYSSLVEQAWEESMTPCDELFMYPLLAGDEPITGTMDACSDNPEDKNNIKVAYTLFVRCPEAVAVQFVRMTPDGKHHPLHRYEKDACIAHMEEPANV